MCLKHYSNEHSICFSLGMGFLFLICFLFSSITQAQTSELHGVWSSVGQGCGLHLSSGEIENLEKLGGNSIYETAILELYGNLYRSSRSNGTFCVDKSPGVYIRNQQIIICSDVVISAGTFHHIDKHKLFFSGKIIQRTPIRYDGLGVVLHEVNYRIDRGVLVFEQDVPQLCLTGEKYISYFIPTPMS